jgi:hypothetical protein
VLGLGIFASVLIYRVSILTVNHCYERFLDIARLSFRKNDKNGEFELVQKKQ